MIYLFKLIRLAGGKVECFSSALPWELCVSVASKYSRCLQCVAPWCCRGILGFSRNPSLPPTKTENPQKKWMGDIQTLLPRSHRRLSVSSSLPHSRDGPAKLDNRQTRWVPVPLRTSPPRRVPSNAHSPMVTAFLHPQRLAAETRRKEPSSARHQNTPASV